MKALCSQAATVTANNYKFNGGTELENSFDVSYYETYFRNYDAQVGRFTGVDGMAESTVGFSPYQFANNNPINFNDPTGATAYDYNNDHLREYGWDSRGGLFMDPEMAAGSGFFSSDSWKVEGGSANYRLTQKDLDNLWESKRGGYWSPTTGVHLFTQEEYDAFGEWLGMAKYVYGGKYANPDNLKGGWLPSNQSGIITLKDPQSGFKSMLFERTINGETEYAYAFAGTEDFLKDFLQDVKQAAGFSEQYNLAISNARKLIKFGLTNITFLGHSLGGGLAQAAALAIDGRAVTFNPAWLSSGTITNNHLDIQKGHIINYIIFGEALNTFQSLNASKYGLIHLGSDRFMSSWRLGIPQFGPILCHLINSF